MTSKFLSPSEKSWTLPNFRSGTLPERKLNSANGFESSNLAVINSFLIRLIFNFFIHIFQCNQRSHSCWRKAKSVTWASRIPWISFKHRVSTENRIGWWSCSTSGRKSKITRRIRNSGPTIAKIYWMVFPNYWKSLGCLLLFSSEIDWFLTKKTELVDEVAQLREENQRLQEESATAAQQLRRFTEWFFQTIEKA